MKKLMRDHIHEVIGYSSARDEFSGTAEVFLDANELPYDNGCNRYPDSRQKEVRKRLSTLRNVSMDQIYLGNGSDSIVDQLVRIFCEPGKDSILYNPPTFPMYKVMAAINKVRIITVDKLANYQLDVPAIKKSIDEKKPKIVFLCSPNNPTGVRLNQENLKEIAEYNPTITIIDEAYIDFDPDFSMINSIRSNNRVIVLQTLSKSWGLAGIRIGAAYADPYIIDRLYAISTPYNVNSYAQEKAVEVLDNPKRMHEQLAEILTEKSRLKVALKYCGLFKSIIPSAANFWVVESDKNQEIYDYLAGNGVIVRNLHRIMPNHMRITVGRPEENDRLIDLLGSF